MAVGSTAFLFSLVFKVGSRELADGTQRCVNGVEEKLSRRLGADEMVGRWLLRSSGEKKWEGEAK